MKKMIVGGLAVLAVAGFAGTAVAVTDGDPYVAPSYGSEKNVEAVALTVDPSTGYASEQTDDSVYVLADVPQEKFVNPAGVLRAGVTPNGELALTVAAYTDEVDAVCTEVGESLDGGSDAVVAQALDQAVTDVESLATPSSLVAFEQRLTGLAERQAELIRSLADGGVDADALGAELEQVEVDIEDLFASEGGFEVCAQA
jgi:hypothetical protein